MKNNILFFTVILLVTTLNMKAQNDSIYFWKSGHLILKQSIKTADLDTITFRKFPTVNLPNVTICNQVWSSANLDVSTYSDGTPIPQITDGTAWTYATTGAWCYYGNYDGNEVSFGKLYNWYAVAGIYNTASLTNPSLRKKLAPNGWHIPTDTEWTTLTNCLGGLTVAANKMRETGTVYWTSPNTGATNSSGFNGRAGGCRRNGGGSFTNGGDTGFFWSSSEFNTTDSLCRWLTEGINGVLVQNWPKYYGYSVRLVKD